MFIKTQIYLWNFTGAVNTAKVLIKNGAEVNSTNINAISSIHLAARNGIVSLVYLTKCYLYFTHFVCVNFEILGKTNMVQLLIDHNANVNAKRVDEQTPLHLAAFEGMYIK